uniref:Uncharacterized protein n=1 Tax=Rhipicephalus appendiculatus TaxID=34631 RepID=A0A131YRX9_RHIAP
MLSFTLPLSPCHFPPHCHHISPSRSLPCPTTLLHTLCCTRLCYPLLACLDSQVVTVLTFRSWGRGFKSCLAKNFSLSLPFFLFSFYLSLSLCVLILSPIRVIASHTGQIGARVLGVQQKRKTMKKWMKTAHAGT